MTAQVPERLIIDGQPRAVFGEPLYRLLASRRKAMRDESPVHNTACHRGYRGTWQLIDGRLDLLHLNLVASHELAFPPGLRARVLSPVPAKEFPVHADWFNGTLRLPLGPQLINSFHGWSHWFQQLRVMQFRGGVLRRDRVVDTHGMIEWWFRRQPEARDALGSDDDAGEPRGTIGWFDASEDEDWGADEWPPDFPAESEPAPTLPTIHWSSAFFVGPR